jgi:hypothetical protein
MGLYHGAIHLQPRRNLLAAHRGRSQAPLEGVVSRRDHRPPSKFDIRKTEDSLDRIEALVRRKEVGLLRAQFRWGANLSEPGVSNQALGHRRSTSASSATETNAGDRRRVSIYLAVREAEKALEHAFGVLEKACGGPTTIARGGDSGAFVTNAQLQEAQAMQRKRENQGGGFGAT